MFIQLDCGCIGLIVEDNNGSNQFYQIIDCADDWQTISFHQSTDRLKYNRFRQLNPEETTAVIGLVQQAISNSHRFEIMQSALELPNQKGMDIVQNLNDAFIKYRTMKAIDTIDKPKIFPFDYRDELEKEKEANYIKRHPKQKE